MRPFHYPPSDHFSGISQLTVAHAAMPTTGLPTLPSFVITLLAITATFHRLVHLPPCQLTHRQPCHHSCKEARYHFSPPRHPPFRLLLANKNTSNQVITIAITPLSLSHVITSPAIPLLARSAIKAAVLQQVLTSISSSNSQLGMIRVGVNEGCQERCG